MTHKERGNLAACLVELDKAHLILGEASPDGAVNDAVEHLITATSLLAAEVRALTDIIAAVREEERRLSYRAVEGVDPSESSGQQVLTSCLMALRARGSQ